MPELKHLFTFLKHRFVPRNYGDHLSCNDGHLKANVLSSTGYVEKFHNS